MGGAIGVADPADLGEIGLALQIVTTRQDLPRHRIKHRLHADRVARRERVARRRDVEPQAPRLFARVEARQRIGRDDQAPAIFERVDIDDPPGDEDRPEPPLEHRRLAFPGGLAGQRKAGAKDEQRQRRLARQRALPQRERGTAGGGDPEDAEPQRRLGRQRKINADPGAEEDRQPEQAAFALGGKGNAERRNLLRAPTGRPVEPSARWSRIRHRRPDTDAGDASGSISLAKLRVLTLTYY